VFPAEFEDLLSAEGRSVLAGTHRLCGALAQPRTRFIASGRLVRERPLAALRRALDAQLLAHLEAIDRPAPPETIWDMTEDYGERLPKTARMLTAYLESAREPSWAAAERLGLLAMLRSASYVAFAEALAGRRLAPRHGLQVLCYRPGDYSGPHNDHHPANPRARAGYVDIHVALASPAVAHQYLVYARAGHLSECVAVAGPGASGAQVTGYRLPFWHYTTPLVARAGRARDARRWVMLGTFLFA
jgi:hypothetical protein